MHFKMIFYSVPLKKQKQTKTLHDWAFITLILVNKICIYLWKSGIHMEYLFIIKIYIFFYF